MKNTLNFYRKIYEPLFAKNYTKSENRAIPALARFNVFIKKNNIKIENIIDVGCAWGRTLKYWKRRKIPIVGVDVVKRIINKNKRRGYQCYLASATDLSIFQDKQFDLYMATDVYEHLRTKDLEYAIEEAKRITRRYFLVRPHPILDKRRRLHLTVWSLEKWQRFFEDNGLKIINFGKNNKICYKNVFLMEN